MIVKTYRLNKSINLIDVFLLRAGGNLFDILKSSKC